MSVVEIEVGKSKYKIECDPGEKERLGKLAEKLNTRVNEISSSLRNVDEKTILVISALMLESDLEEQNAEVQTHTNTNTNVSNEEELHQSLRENVENISHQIDKLANKIRDY